MTETTAPKQPGKRFVRGQSGNPSGRPAGARHAALMALDAIGSEGAAAVMLGVVNAAKGGDMRAAEILLRRLWPERRGRPVLLDLPAISDSVDIVAALSAITGAVAAGELTPDEGAAVASIIETQRRAVETLELERRLAVLERTIAERGS